MIGTVISISLLGALILVLATISVCEHFHSKELETLWEDYDDTRKSIMNLVKTLAICEHELKAYKESDVQSQVNEMAKIVEERSGRDFHTSRDIAIALHSKGYRLKGEASDERKDSD